MEEMKAHYKTDWHRYNLKRKVGRDEEREGAGGAEGEGVCGLGVLSLRVWLDTVSNGCWSRKQYVSSLIYSPALGFPVVG